ncbi:unnamed protein product [Bemisia tabaci]|uniref:Ionotropic glutamate receptor C-terminal domain-containing protein n=1 Tax=Bemisia tabaci TaxID=7038 RepID=A0A9P0EX72_BEMTA|nr:unnamed protein product [Bemisia tabaci]
MRSFNLFLPTLLNCFVLGPKPGISHQLPMTEDQVTVSSLAFKVCQNTIVNTSSQALFYVLDFQSDVSMTPLIEHLHENNIQTIQLNKLSEFEAIDEKQMMNMILFFDDIDELISFVLESSTHEIRGTYVENRMFNGSKSEHSRSGNKSSQKRMLYCVDFDGDSESTIFEKEKSCDFKLHVTTDELLQSSILSEHVFNATRGLYTHSVWNSKNNIIFMLKRATANLSLITGSQRIPMNIQKSKTMGRANVSNDLTVYFQFFWRFFRGYKVVVCSAALCTRYEPFAEKISHYTGAVGEAYFDFNWSNMCRKTIAFDVGGYLNGIGLEWNSLTFAYSILLHNTIEYLGIAVNGTVENKEGFTKENNYEMGQKYPIDLFLTAGGAALAQYDSNVEYTISVENCVVSIFTPHSALIPQGIVIFKGFSKTVWMFVLGTFTLFVVVQHLFQFSQQEWFRRFYSEAQIDYFAGMSSTLTIFSYFMCGGPPCLQLGRLLTGKILFLIFSFSALVISTVFLSNMTTLLTDRVRYPEIDSLEDLMESDLFIQTGHEEIIYMTNEDKYKGLRDNVIHSYAFYLDLLDEWVSENIDLYLHYMNVSAPESSFSLTPERRKYIGMFMRNLKAIDAADAILALEPSVLFSHRSVQMRSWFRGKEPVELHLSKEYLAKFPFLFPILKNSFLFDRFNKMLFQLFESGHVSVIFKDVMTEEFCGTTPSELPESEPLRPYSLNDLQAAFIFLGVGLFCSCIVFIAELSNDLFRNSLSSVHLRRFRVNVFEKKK